MRVRVGVGEGVGLGLGLGVGVGVLGHRAQQRTCSVAVNSFHGWRAATKRPKPLQKAILLYNSVDSMDSKTDPSVQGLVVNHFQKLCG